jgi:serpin B
VACALAVFIVSGCSGAIATPSSSPASPRATNSLPSPLPSPSSDGPAVVPSPTPTAQPPGADVPSWLAGDFSVAMGRSTNLAADSDMGLATGQHIDDFGFELLRRIQSKDKNLCVSPTSIALAFAMVRLGARGQTAVEMDKVLAGLAPKDAAQVLALIADLRSQASYLASDGAMQILMPDTTPDPTWTPAVELNMANEAFLQKGMKFEQPYLDALYSEFGAGLGLLDFSANPEAARLAINKWASDQTRGRIPNALQPGDVDNSSRIALANAMYLHAGWQVKFDPKKTTGRTFTTSAGNGKTVPTMAETIETRMASTREYQAIVLPYSGNLWMTVIVPTDMTGFVNSLTASKLNSIESSMPTYKVDLRLPKFSIDSRFNLADTLSQMGMPTAFTPQADFSGISADQPLMLKRVIHQANIDVVEDGTTAAAVTISLGSTTGGMPPEYPKAQLRIDKPFLYFVQGGQGVVLFEGVVNDPTSK